MSDGIYTPLGEQGTTSVGQKQLLALARAGGDAANPDPDEATASIDSGTEQAIQHALAAVRTYHAGGDCSPLINYC